MTADAPRAAPTLRVALAQLANEANAIAEMARPCIGNTNVKVLLTRIAEARAALAAMEEKKCPVGIDWCPLGKVEP